MGSLDRQPLARLPPCNIQGVWIKEQSLSIKDGKIEGYRVVMKVTFLFEE